MSDLKCAAFPNGIPEDILKGSPHIDPHKGDNGITFKIESDNEWADYFRELYGDKVIQK